MTILDELAEGIFIEESKNRFLCSVLIKEMIYECYVPSASKLRNYLNMKNKKVLLLKNNKNNLRTKYSIFAVKYYNKYIILNMSVINKILEEYLREKYTFRSIEREKYFHGYKSDLLVLGEIPIMIEAKGIISAKREIKFPTVYCQRAIDQLKKIRKLLIEGYKVEYYIISLSPTVKVVKINDDLKFKEYTDLLISCIDLGMLFNGFNIEFKNNNIEVGYTIKILSRDGGARYDKSE